MHPTWQLLERHAGELAATPILWIDPPELHPGIKAEDWLVTPDRSVYRDSPAIPLTPDEAWPAAARACVLFYPKAKERLEWWLAQIHERLPDARIWVVGENNGGIKSLPKRVRDYARVEKIDTARHCALYGYYPAGPLDAGHWAEFNHGEHRIYALPGVFSQRRLDRGTAVLIDALPAFRGSVLEFGCGSGVLGCDILTRSRDAQLTAVDIDWLAVRSAGRTLADAGLAERATLLWSDGLDEVPGQRFDALVTNPPFHAGVKTHYQPSDRFFSDSHNWLRRGGELWWVANDFLDYRPRLETHYRHIEQCMHRNGFRVFRAVRA